MKISSELLQQIIKEEITQVLSEFDATNIVDFFRGGKVVSPPAKEEFRKQIENFGELNRQNWKQFLCLALKTRPRREEHKEIANQMFISKLESANFDQNVSNQIFSLYAKLSQNDEQAERFCSNNSQSRSKQMGDESVQQQTTEEQPKKNRKERRAEKSKRGGESQGSNGGNKVGPSQGAPKPRARRRQ